MKKKISPKCLVEVALKTSRRIKGAQTGHVTHWLLVERKKNLYSRHQLFIQDCKYLGVLIVSNVLDNFWLYCAYSIIFSKMLQEVKISASEQFLSYGLQILKSLNPSYFKELQGAFVLNHVFLVQICLL